jgi:hypothetical protein
MYKQTQPNVFFDYSRYDKTHNKAIDLCAACIGHYRRFSKPLKTIYLKENLFDLFRKGMEFLMGREMEPGEQFEFDGVRIEKSSILMVGKDLYVDFWIKEEKEIIN